MGTNYGQASRQLHEVLAQPEFHPQARHLSLWHWFTHRVWHAIQSFFRVHVHVRISHFQFLLWIAVLLVVVLVISFVVSVVRAMLRRRNVRPLQPHVLMRVVAPLEQAIAALDMGEIGKTLTCLMAACVQHASAQHWLKNVMPGTTARSLETELFTCANTEFAQVFRDVRQAAERVHFAQVLVTSDECRALLARVKGQLREVAS